MNLLHEASLHVRTATSWVCKSAAPSALETCPAAEVTCTALVASAAHLRVAAAIQACARGLRRRHLPGAGL